MPPQNMPLLNIDSFDLKALQMRQMQEGSSDFSLSTWKQDLPLPVRKVPFLQQENENIFFISFTIKKKFIREREHGSEEGQKERVLGRLHAEHRA